MCDLLNYRGNDCHVVYKNLFIQGDDENIDAHISYIRRQVSDMWEKFKPLSDRHFIKEFRHNPDQRYWEMYLGACLLEKGFDIKSANEGPDFFLNLDHQKVWIEAITASPGEIEKADTVPKMLTLSEGGGVQNVPRDQIILRYRNALSEKEKKFSVYKQRDIVGENDINIIAISRASLRSWPEGDRIPFILSALFPLGHEFLSIDRKTGEVVDQGHHFQASIKKRNGADVETLYFTDPVHSNISAVIYSSSDLGNPPKARGCDLVIIHNPLAKTPLPRKFFKFDTEFWAEETGNGWKLHRD